MAHMEGMRHLALLIFCLLPLSAMAQPPALSGDGKRHLQSLALFEGSPTPVYGNRPILVTFFASWCPPCTAEFRELNKLRAAFPEDRLAILAVNLFEDYSKDKNGRRMQRFLKRTAPTFPLVHAGDKAKLEEIFGPLKRIPTVFIFDADGRVIYSFIHETGATKMNSSFEEMAAALGG